MELDQTKVNYFDILPNEAIIKIFSFLPWVTCIRIEGVCKKWLTILLLYPWQYFHQAYITFKWHENVEATMAFFKRTSSYLRKIHTEDLLLLYQTPFRRHQFPVLEEFQYGELSQMIPGEYCIRKMVQILSSLPKFESLIILDYRVQCSWLSELRNVQKLKIKAEFYKTGASLTTVLRNNASTLEALFLMGCFFNTMKLNLELSKTIAELPHLTQLSIIFYKESYKNITKCIGTLSKILEVSTSLEYFHFNADTDVEEIYERAINHPNLKILNLCCFHPHHKSLVQLIARNRRDKAFEPLTILIWISESLPNLPMEYYNFKMQNLTTSHNDEYSGKYWNYAKFAEDCCKRTNFDPCQKCNSIKIL